MYRFTFMNLKMVLLVLVILLIGCDGGTSGTGLKTYEGVVTSTNGNPIPDVNLTIESTGESTKTDENGEFSLDSMASGAQVPFLAEGSNFTTRFSVDKITEESSRVSVNVKVDTDTDIATVTHLVVSAKFAGLCDYYFENREVLRQSNRVPPGSICTIKIAILGDGRPVANIPIALQYASCESNAVWETLETTFTGLGRFKGSAEIHFEFRDSPTFCRYRILAPYGVSDFRQVTYPIDTFTEQGITSDKDSKSTR